MRIYDSATDVIKQGGKRRGANMGVLHISHPDIEEFITAKQGAKKLSNFNISVAATDKFMSAAKTNKTFKLINPRNHKIVKKVNAKKIFDLIVRSAWKTGDPGLIFIDEINRKNPTPKLAKIEGTNPCGEVPLLAYESCNLGSINLNKMLIENKIDWKRLEKTIRTAVHFLDNVIDANKYPLPQIEEMTKANRKIGLGIMGFADTLIRLKIPYDSKEAVKLAEKIISFIEKTAVSQSKEIAKKRGAFPNHNKGRWKFKLRNATLTTIAPTGTISIIAGCSSGIEPLFALSFIRNVMEGKRLLEVNHAFQLELVKQRLWSEHLIKKIAQTGSCQRTGLPKTIKNVFRTSLDIKPEWHVKMQAAFQKYVDNAVSKTVNLPNNTSANDVKKIYELAHKLKCKGITVYRYGSKPEQVLYIGKEKGKKLTIADISYSGGCASGICQI
jgi:ribonucleoside-diphosphate reductase alpha chain